MRIATRGSQLRGRFFQRPTNNFEPGPTKQRFGTEVGIIIPGAFIPGPRVRLHEWRALLGGEPYGGVNQGQSNPPAASRLAHCNARYDPNIRVVHPGRGSGTVNASQLAARRHGNPPDRFISLESKQTRWAAAGKRCHCPASTRAQGT